MTAILVVDDERSARTTLALLLRKRGYRVLQADGATTAVERLLEESVDLVVTDLETHQSSLEEIFVDLMRHAS